MLKTIILLLFIYFKDKLIKILRINFFENLIK